MSRMAPSESAESGEDAIKWAVTGLFPAPLCWGFCFRGSHCEPARCPCTHAHYPPDTVACDGAALNARLKAMLVMPRGPAESEACKLSWCSASLAPCVHHACFTSHRARVPRCSLACCMPPSIQTARRGSAHSRHANSSSMAAAAACSGGATAIKQASGGLPQLPYVGDLCFCVHNVFCLL